MQQKRCVLCVCVCLWKEERKGEKHKIDKRNEVLKKMYINKENIKYKNVALQGRITDSL